MKRLFVVLTMLGLNMLACGAPSEGDIQTAIAQTAPAADSSEAQPAEADSEPEQVATLTPLDDPTSLPPTDTPEPTETPEPTDTPVPTDTPAPTPTQEPQLYSGSGDSIVDVDWGAAPAVAHIVGNAGSRFFSIKSFDANNKSIDLLVNRAPYANTGDVYDGVKLINFSGTVARFEVSATGEWTIEISDLLEAPTIEIPGQIEGIGDSVFLVRADDLADTALIKGNEDSAHFAVWAYARSSKDLLVNTTDPYDGTVLVAPDIRLVEITAVGEWSFEITGR